MKKISILIMLFLLCFSSMMVFVPSVIGATGDVILTDWEEFNIGVESGSGVFVDFEKISGTFEVVNHDNFGVGTKNLKVYDSADGATHGKGWINITDDFSYIGSIQLLLELNTADASGNAQSYIYFYNNSIEVLKFQIDDNVNINTDTFGYYDVNNVLHVLDASLDEDLTTFYLNISHISGNSMNYTWYDSVNGVEVSSDDSSRTVYTWTTFDSIYIDGFGILYLDDIIINTESEIGEGSYTDSNMYIRLWDYETGERLAFSHEQTPYETMQTRTTVFPSARILINDLAVTYDREIYTKDQYIGLTATINSGINRIQLFGIGYMRASPGYEYMGFIWNNRYSSDGSYLWKPFYNHDINITISQGSIIDIYLIPIGYTEQPENSKEWNFYNDLICEISTDKNVYTSGEQMIITYKIPSILEFDEVDMDTSGWQLAIHKSGIGWYNRLYGDFTSDAEYLVPNDDFDIIYGYTAIIYLDVDDLGLSAGVNDFEINIGHIGGGLLWQNRYLTLAWDEGLWFKVINGTFTPNGTIADIEPDYPLIGERTLISFTANNRGKLVYQDLLDLTHQEYVITTFEKPTGAVFVNTSFYSIAPYKVTLCVWDGYQLQDVDNAFVQVNGSGENYSGYNIEYCEISKDRYIAGFSYAEIAYHSLNTTATFIIKTPKDERSRYSTILTETEGVYRFKIDAFSQIGKYNVTFIGLDTYYSYFYVVYNENNYIEFAKNVFTTNENFVLFVRNDVRIGLTFYQKDMHDNYVPRGENIYFTENTIASYVTIDKSQVKPEIGEWRVEMWQVNDRARIRLLATWDCTVIQYSASTDLPPVNIDIINSIPYALKLFLGILIPILFAIIPLLVIAFISKTGREIDNLEIICVAFFFFGMFISILLTFLPVASIFIVLLGVIVTFALMYVQRKEG